MIDAILKALREQGCESLTDDETILTRDLYDLLHLRRAPLSGGTLSEAPAIRARDLFGPAMRREEGWVASKSARTSALIFEKAGLRLRVEPGNVIGDGALSLPAVRDRLSPGFAGLLSPSEPPNVGVRVYVPVASDAAADAGRELAAAVQAVTARYVIKGLNLMHEYPRPDAFTIYISRPNLEPLLDAISQRNIKRFLVDPPLHSLFAKAEPAGVCWMEGSARESAGSARAACVARAIRRHVEDTDSLATVIEREFSAAGIDAKSPYMLADGASRGV